MDISKVHTPKVTIGNMLAIAALAIGGLGYVIANAESMATLKAQIPAIQATQEREVEIQKERYEENKERAKRIEMQQQQNQQMLQQILRQTQ
jgi:hypothetical protein